jgi:hypothetical protein
MLRVSRNRARWFHSFEKENRAKQASSGSFDLPSLDSVRDMQTGAADRLASRVFQSKYGDARAHLRSGGHRPLVA